MTTRNQAVGLATLGSAALLGGAFAFQYIGGLQPCTLCIWQRWPHAAAILIGVLALTLLRGRPMVALGMLAALTAAGLGVYHAGVEIGVFEGLTSCSSGSISGIAVGDLLNPDVDVAAPVPCGEVVWSLFGLSMAGWNALISFGLAGVWAYAFTRRA
jgi:disulfide bond formation protein DsbB